MAKCKVEAFLGLGFRVYMEGLNWGFIRDHIGLM